MSLGFVKEQMKLTKLFLIWSAIMVLTVFIYALIYPNPAPKNFKEVDFSTTQSSTLFFKNIRSYFYELEEREDANFKIYRIKSRTKDDRLHKLNFALVHNWRQSECYIIAEVNNKYSEHSLQYFENGTLKTISFQGEDAYANYLFAAELYLAIEKGKNFYFRKNGVKDEFTKEELKSLEKTLFDYFKWIGKLR